jgi:hypothetical protein
MEPPGGDAVLIDRKGILRVIPHIGPRPPIKATFDALLEKLEYEEKVGGKEFNLDVALAVVDWWIAALFVTRSYIENHAAGGRDYEYADKPR